VPSAALTLVLLVLGWAWVPLTVCCAVQMERRTLHPARHADALILRQSARTRAGRSRDEIRNGVVVAVIDACSTVVEESLRKFRATRPGVTPEQVHLIADGLAAASSQSGLLVERLSHSERPASESPEPVRRFPKADFVWAVIAAVALVLTEFWGRALEAPNTPLAVLLPFGMALSAILCCAVVGLGTANGRSMRSLQDIETETRAGERDATTAENAVRAELVELIHGPIQGRLAACAMALNFHADEVGSSLGKEEHVIIAAVLEQLDALREELSALSGSMTHRDVRIPNIGRPPRLRRT
jgi:hypothetical protein